MNTNNGSYYFRQLMEKSVVSFLAGVALILLNMETFRPSLLTQAGQCVWLGIAFLSAAVVVYSGYDFYKNAYFAFKNHHATMDTLISIGTAAAWFYSVFIILFPHHVLPSTQHVYFETALIILAFVNLGAALELRARGKTSLAIQNLMTLQPHSANQITSDGHEITVAIEDIKKDDVIRIKSGERIPVDGVIISGHSTVDEAMLTGESTPSQKNADSLVYAGTMNLSGSFDFRVTRVGNDTTLAKIIQLVQNAQGTKPAVTKLTDTVASYFVPTVLIVAIITALTWMNVTHNPHFSLMTAIAVLIIACPCALGLAAPISIMLGIGQCAEIGVLVRDGQALQKITDISTIVLDKTGTITTGKPEVIEVISEADFDESQLLSLAASVEQYSEHPLASAITTYAHSRNIVLQKASHFESTTGFGIKAVVGEQTVLLGNANFMGIYHVNITALSKAASKAAQLAQTPIYVSVDQKAAGLFIIADPIRPEAANAIETLKIKGFETILMTGDHLQTAEAIAKQVGIRTVFAENLPDEKAHKIKQLQFMGKKVLMMGDGINDAPALSQADVGIAMGSGTDIAIESADIALLNLSLMSVIQAMDIAKKTMRNIKQNLFGAFIYNILGIVVASGVLYPFFHQLLDPMIAGAAMALSSLTVVYNANRLKSIRKMES